MFTQSFLLLSLAGSAFALPFYNFYPGSGCTPESPMLPTNGGSSELPAPPEDVKLKHIALGFGIQNYSCADTDANPVAIGALAVLYDITFLYPGQSSSSVTPAEWSSFPSYVLDAGQVPLNRNEDGGASLTNPFPRNDRSGLTGVPTFDLDKANQLLVAKKISSIEAPSSAPAGPEGTGAVDWLYLGDAGGSYGISFVYRVLTAGGAPHSCEDKGSRSTSYTTLYWFYG
ncbi:unnamed protein product [Fusarium langsethiae]|nr:unnamed protein product [Fusarium langsethiae]